MFLVSHQKRENRYRICKECEHFVATTKSCGTLGFGSEVQHNGETRKLCGCVMPIKVRLKVCSCPLDKWFSEITDQLVQQIRTLIDGMEDDRITGYENQKLTELWNQAAGRNRTISNCKSCVRGMIEDLKNVLKEADNDTKTS